MVKIESESNGKLFRIFTLLSSHAVMNEFNGIRKQKSIHSLREPQFVNDTLLACSHNFWFANYLNDLWIPISSRIAWWQFFLKSICDCEKRYITLRRVHPTHPFVLTWGRSIIHRIGSPLTSIFIAFLRRSWRYEDDLFGRLACCVGRGRNCGGGYLVIDCGRIDNCRGGQFTFRCFIMSACWAAAVIILSTVAVHSYCIWWESTFRTALVGTLDEDDTHD